MKRSIVINGNKLLKGEVKISGSKNCALCLIAGALLSKDEVILRNIPDIEDIRIFIKILNYLNVVTEFKNNTLKINSKNLIVKDLLIPEISKFRASPFFDFNTIKLSTIF